jgi:glycosyltransferase involved in cell wall biosynthesis
MKRLIIGGCVKNVGRYLPYIFKNIEILSHLFTDVKVIFSYDESRDNTLQLIHQYMQYNKNAVLIMNNNNSIRTVNIANARNAIMNYIKNTYPDYDLLCFIDCDDIINAPFKPEVFKKAIELYDQWDALSFNREGYYDIWALRYPPHMLPCHSFGIESRTVIGIIQSDIINILKNLKENELYRVMSAFNGVALFKLNKFLNARFDGLYHHINYQPAYPYKFIMPKDECEWVNFHNNAREINEDLKVMISQLKPY